MRTTLKIETGTENLEVELKIVDGKQIVELELSQLLALFGGKKTPAKVAKVQKGAKKAKSSATEISAPAIAAPASKPAGAKRGRKPKSASTGVSPFGSKDN